MPAINHYAPAQKNPGYYTEINAKALLIVSIIEFCRVCY